MSNLMKLLGTVLALLGLVLGAICFAQPGRMAVYGIQLETAVLLLVGGILAVGLGGVIDAFRTVAPRKQSETAVVTVASGANEATKSTGVFVKRTAEAGAVTATAAGATILATPDTDTEEEARNAPAKAAAAQVSDTINALEQAKQDIIKSIGGMDQTAGKTEAEPVVAETADEEEPAVTESESGAEGLYVVEEKVIRGRPARILSDDTIEAETDEGWMRFEDFDHLNEYLDSMEEQAS